MKKPKNKAATSRRQFLKKAGRAAAASGLAGIGLAGGCSTPGRAGSPNPSPKSRPDRRSKKLGPDKDNNLPPKFSLRRRMPYWAPDEMDGPGGTAITLYPEEALRLEDKKSMCLDAPPLVDGPAFQEWALGSKLDPKKVPFDDWLVKLCKLIRSYNRALYRLRAARLKEEQNKDLMKPLPDDNVTPGGEEHDWTRIVKEMADHLHPAKDPPDRPHPVAVDMIEVNGYIISVRAVAGVPADSQRDGPNVRQIGGSESSHISISSAFSSPK